MTTKPTHEPTFYPFDGRKALYHVPHWENIERGVIPPPVLVTLDPIHRCNLNCSWCNSAATIDKSGESYSSDVVERMGQFLLEWGVRAVCVAGGGEPTLHPQLSSLIHGLVDVGLDVGIVTNGTRLTRHSEALRRCRWVGVSVDSGSRDEYRTLKGVDKFDSIVRGMRLLREASPDLEITWKMLMHPDNILSLPRAATVADDTGCTYLHARPVGLTWEDVAEGVTGSPFSREQVRIASRLVESMSAHQWPSGMRVLGTTQKFSSDDWGIYHPFTRCHAVGMTCGIQANGHVTLCCDRRGDSRVELCSWDSLEDIREAWGSNRHWEVMKSINLQECPRCTYAPHNKLYGEFVTRDDSCKNMI